MSVLGLLLHVHLYIKYWCSPEDLEPNTVRIPVALRMPGGPSCAAMLGYAWLKVPRLKLLHG